MLPYCWSSAWAMAYLLLALCYFLSITQFSASQNISLPGCPSSCGDVQIPYPFGIGINCAREGFDLNCNHSFNPPKIYLRDSSIVELLSISLLEAQARVRYFRKSDCYTREGEPLEGGNTVAQITDPYTFSNLHNKFTVLGCDTYAYIRASNSSEFTSGCTSVCDRLDRLVNDSCSGIGCCQTAIPKGLDYFEIEVKSFDNHTAVWNFNPCSYAFLVDQDWFNFSAADITGDSKYRSTVDQVPLVLDWVAGKETCAVARKDKSTYACRSENSECYESTTSAIGYLCNCSLGYEGNPYLIGGCQDINECMREGASRCEGLCINHPGSYQCVCPKGTSGNPSTYGCLKNRKTTATIILATVIPCLVVTSLIVCLYGLFEKRKRTLLAQKFYQKNGGTILERHMSTHDHIRSMLQIFTKVELEEATEIFHDSKLLGRGGQGVVYEGTLQDNLHVAIKKSVIFVGVRIDDFINEIIILSQINHRNVVRLLGCCLEVEVPYLVYEFVPNNTLFYHIQNGMLQWKTRLRIAADTAGALAYLHTKVAIPIYHQDVKSTNILLDWDYTAKVSDFGASKLVLDDKEALNTLVQGTLGYLDPEYLQTHELTDKSDVYSFGVVLVELLTGREPISYLRSEKERCLAQHFKLCMEENKLIDILDSRILVVSTSTIMNQMIEVAKLAAQCINFEGKKRPNMMEVSLELERLWRSTDHQLVGAQVVDEIEYLLRGQILNNQGNNQKIYFNNDTNTQDVAAFSINTGR